MVVLTTAFAALLSLPCALAVVIRSDNTAIRRAWIRWGRADRALLRRLDHGLREVIPPPIRPGLPTIEQAVAELRRLDRQRRSGPTSGSAQWTGAVLRAYDEWLKVACTCVGVTHHLSGLDGMDLDLERVRVEDALLAAGCEVRSAFGRGQH
jgi:hypothetical protein